jgi:hypothetical protein
MGFREIKFSHLRNHLSKFFILRSYLGGISRDLYFHLWNYFCGFFTFKIISVGFHEIDFSPSESFRWIFHLRNRLGGISRDRFFSFGIISVNFSPSESSRWDFTRLIFHLRNHFVITVGYLVYLEPPQDLEFLPFGINHIRYWRHTGRLRTKTLMRPPNIDEA